MSVIFYRGQQLGREDLHIYFSGANGTPKNAAEITYALYDFTTGQEVLLGPPNRVPQNPAVGEYFASIVVPLDANLGNYRIRWTFKEYIGAPQQQVVQEFAIQDRANPSPLTTTYTTAETDLIRRLRILTRDNCIGEEEEVELDVDGEKMVVSFRDLYDAIGTIGTTP